MRPAPLLSLVAALAGCSDESGYVGALWAPGDLAATPAGLYSPLPDAEGLAFLTADGAAAPVDLGDRTLVDVTTSPDGAIAWARLAAWSCEVDDRREARRVKVRADCHTPNLVATRTLHPLTAGVVGAAIDVDPQYDAFEWSADGRFAIGYTAGAVEGFVNLTSVVVIDTTTNTSTVVAVGFGARAAAIDVDPQYDAFEWSADGRFAIGYTAGAVEGFVNLTSVVVIDTTTNTSTVVAVGFGARAAAFSADNSKVLVLTKGEAVLIDLTGTPKRVVSYELTSSASEVVSPIGAEITADGHYALVTLAGKRDLYVLDLVSPSVNLVGLSGTPVAMLDGDRTILAYTDAAAIDLLDHDLFDIKTIRLDSPVDRIVPIPGAALLWRQGAQDVYRLDLTTDKVVRYRLVGAARALELLPDDSGALVFSGTNTVEFVDFTSDDGDIDLVFGLGNVPLAMAITPSALGPKAIVLLQDSDEIVLIDVFAATASTLELAAPPLGIGALPGGPFYVAEDEPLGLVGFLDPETLAMTEAAGFGTLGLLDEVPVTVVEAEAR